MDRLLIIQYTKRSTLLRLKLVFELRTPKSFHYGFYLICDDGLIGRSTNSNTSAITYASAYAGESEMLHDAKEEKVCQSMQQYAKGWKSTKTL